MVAAFRLAVAVLDVRDEPEENERVFFSFGSASLFFVLVLWLASPDRVAAADGSESGGRPFAVGL
jgi:hypothetical protein